MSLSKKVVMLMMRVLEIHHVSTGESGIGNELPELNAKVGNGD
jgi:hypothetical protein